MTDANQHQGPDEEPIWRGDFESPSLGSRGAGDLIVGQRAIYRLGFVSMAVLDMPEEMVIGDVSVRHIDGPVQAQKTTVVQKPGLQPTFEKWMEHPWLGAGQRLMLLELPVAVTESLGAAMAAWRAEALSAAGFLAALLDERVAQEELLEDIVVLDPEGKPFASVDIKPELRTFEPSHPWFSEYSRDLFRYAQVGNGRLRTACRWYLRAVTARPTPESIVLFWIALESLVPALAGAKPRNDVRAVEDAVQRADPSIDPSHDIDPTVGRMAGLRARIVHQGVEHDPLVPAAFYTLESLSRLLIRHEFGVAGGWPYFPADPMLRPPFANIPRPPRTIWRDPPTGAT